MTLKQKWEEAQIDAKKRRRVGFAKMDGGIEANECIKLFLVSSQDEVCATNGCCIDPVDLNPFFGEDGKIYGYKDLKINIWLSIVSFHAYTEVTYESTFDGGKGITDLKPGLQNLLGEALVKKSEFLHTFSTESQCVKNIISNGTVLQCYVLKEEANASDTNSDADDSFAEHQVVRMDLHNLPVGLLYSRMVALAFLLIDGSSPIDVSDPQWDIYFSVKKIRNKLGEYDVRILGFATVYRFYHHPDSTRLRLSQILVFPPYQGQGHGRCLLESVNSVAVAEGVYDLTYEEPSEYLQYLRSCIDTLRLLDFEPIKLAVNSAASLLKTGSIAKKPLKSLAGPPTHAVVITRQKLKINKKQFLRCWDILLYLNLDPKSSIIMENFRSCISARIKSDILDKDSETSGKRLIEVENSYDHDMMFVMYYCLQGEHESDNGKVVSNLSAQEEQLNQLVDKQMEEIIEIAKKVSLLRSSGG